MCRIFLLFEKRESETINMECFEKSNTLKKAIFEDIQKSIFEYYDSKNVKYKETEESSKTLMNFIAYHYRLIPIRKRNVHFSDVLEKSAHIEILKKYEKYIHNGGDMNVHLSNKMYDSKQPDFLQFTWHLFHLHLNVDLSKKRSDLQLLCIINDSDVCFVDTIEHPSKFKPELYFDIQHLRTIIRNGWMDKIGFFEINDMVPGSLSPKITDSKDIFDLYRRGVNIGFEIDEKGYFPIEGINCVKKPIAVSELFCVIDRNVQTLSYLTSEYIGVRFGIDSNGNLFGMAKFRSENGELREFNIICDAERF